jgi:putative tryptophan/tyrosine transport system substrate-binding protein
MKRREFVAATAGALSIRPLGLHAQQNRPVIGFLGTNAPELTAGRLRAFREGLAETGYSEGRNVEIEYRWANGDTKQLPALAAILAARHVNVIVTSSTSSTVAAKAATGSIPIVFNVSNDPVQAGLVASLNRPGGNATGSTGIGVEIGPKRLEVMHEVLPDAKTLALLINPTNPRAHEQYRDHHAAAAAFGLRLVRLEALTEREIEAAIARLKQQEAAALVITPDSFFSTHSEQIAGLALRHAVPAISNDRAFPTAGGLMSYGGSITAQYRIAGAYAGRILNGEKPADLPVEQPTKFDLIINFKTATALGITIPPTLLVRADEVIE